MSRGGIYVRVSSCHLLLVSESEKTAIVSTNEVGPSFKQLKLRKKGEQVVTQM